METQTLKVNADFEIEAAVAKQDGSPDDAATISELAITYTDGDANNSAGELTAPAAEGEAYNFQASANVGATGKFEATAKIKFADDEELEVKAECDITLSEDADAAETLNLVFKPVQKAA